MKQRFIILVVIFVVLLSGCGTVSKKSAVNNASTYAQSENNKAGSLNKENLEDSSTDNTNSSPASQASTAKTEAQSTESLSLNAKLFDYLSTAVNRNSVEERASELHGGTLHNSCVYYASEALRRVGVSIPNSMSYIPNFINELKKLGFKTSYNLNNLKPGDICFTTNAAGVVGAQPTHTFIFMGWQSPGVALVVDNQAGDYGSAYHTRLITAYYLNNQKDKPKEATAFFMYR